MLLWFVGGEYEESVEGEEHTWSEIETLWFDESLRLYVYPRTS
jgi:hypothetical protein